ncbi:hypothetical protein CJ030_MR7G010723 [Morella rubra]|uniref:Uncharacterized protein n=1 Tax=Morella rubra TaxID=262757 RepID=A0A6A1UZ32_9ROSI|nr:hypothetical protein CJ030_MR7G010723 [Morella rubra]
MLLHDGGAITVARGMYSKVRDELHIYLEHAIDIPELLPMPSPLQPPTDGQYVCIGGVGNTGEGKGVDLCGGAENMGDGRGVDMCGGDAIRGAEGGDFYGAYGANEDLFGDVLLHPLKKDHGMDHLLMMFYCDV